MTVYKDDDGNLIREPLRKPTEPTRPDDGPKTITTNWTDGCKMQPHPVIV